MDCYKLVMKSFPKLQVPRSLLKLFYVPRSLLHVFLSLLVACLLALPLVASADSPPIKSAAEIDYPPFSIVHDDGRADGFSVELMRAALKAMNREVVFRNGPWTEVRGWLERGEIQALPLVGRTPEREHLFDFTFAYMTLHGAIVVRDDNHDIHHLGDLRGRKVAVMEGDNAEEFLRREERGIQIRTTTTFDEALRLVSKGECDAVVIQRLVALRLLQETGISNLRVLDRPVEGFQQDFCFAVKEGDRDTLALLNEGLSIVMADGTYRNLHAKWFAALQLPTDRPIVVAGDHNYPPFEFLDDKGRPAGFTVDLTRAIARRMDMDVRIRLGPWTKVLEGMEKGDIDAIQGIFYSPERDRTLDFSPPYLVSHYVSVVRKGSGPPPETVEDLTGKRLVVEAGDVIQDFLVKQGLGAQISVVETQEDVLRAVSEGRYDCGVTLRVSALYLIKKHGWKNLELSSRSLFSGEYCYAVPGGNSALIAQFSEGLKVVQESGEFHRIYDKWLGGYEERPPSLVQALRYSAMVLIPLVLILLAIFLWSWSLRQQVAAKTRELKESVDRFKYVFESANVGKSMTLPSGEVNANKAFADFLGYTQDELEGKRWQDLTSDEDIEATEKIIEALIAGETDSVRFEKRYIHKNGDILWGDVSTALRRDSKGAPLYFVTTIVDITQRKRTEEALRASEEFQRAMIACSPVALYRIDLKGNVVVWNESAERIFGWNAEEIIGRPLPIVPEGMEDEFASLRNRTIESGGFSGLEVVRRRKNGSLFDASLSAAAVYDEKGEIIGVMGSIADITDRKHSERALRESEAKYRLLVENQTDLVVKVDLDGRFLFVSPSYCRLFGKTEEALLGQNFMPLVHEDDREPTAEAMKALYSPPYTAYVEQRAMTKEGWSWLAWVDTAVLDSQGNVQEIIGVGRDISDRKQAEEALKTERLQLLSIFDSIDEVIYVADPDTYEILYVNQAIRAAFQKEMIGGICYREFQGFDAPCPFCTNDIILKQKGQPYRWEYHNPILDRDYAIVDRIITWPDGRDVRFELAIDITERKRAEAEREKLQTQLIQAQKMESVGRLAGGVAHDFNNKLTVILGYAQMAMESLNSTDPIYANLQQVMKAGEQSVQIVSQLLAFARKQTIAPKVLDLNETIEGMLKMLRRLIGEDIDLAWEPDSHLWAVRMDPSQIDQILANLCVNARDAITGVGKVTIETENVVLDENYCADRAGFVPGAYVMLGVSDNGCGMDKETLANAFEPFFTTKEVGKGTGLGLATVYGIVKQNNGFVNIYSEPSKGTTVKIYLPRHSEEAEEKVEAVPNEIPWGRGETILVVEDDDPLLRLARRTLEGLGYVVITSANPKEAIAMAKGHDGDIHLLLTDVVLPEMSGKELTGEISKVWPAIRVLYMSGYTANVIAHHGVLDEGVHFIGKPFTPESLARKVREALESEE